MSHVLYLGQGMSPDGNHVRFLAECRCGWKTHADMAEIEFINGSKSTGDVLEGLKAEFSAHKKSL